MFKTINIIFDGPPGPVSGRFVEIETDNGESIRIQEGDYWKLRITELPKINKGGLMKYPFFGTNVYWHFKGEKAYRYGYPTQINNGLIRMGRWNGDTMGGVIVDLKDIEVKR